LRKLARRSHGLFYTERKRIRKSFGSRDSVLKSLPAAMQKDAYTAFLQADVGPSRTVEGLQAAFDARFQLSRTTASSR